MQIFKVGGLVWKRKKHGENDMEKSRRGVRISYGFYCVENQDGCEGSVVAQKVETDSISMRLFGVFDQQMEGLITTGHLQSLLLSNTKNLNEVQNLILFLLFLFSFLLGFPCKPLEISLLILSLIPLHAVYSSLTQLIETKFYFFCFAFDLQLLENGFFFFFLTIKAAIILAAYICTS